nr:hypothetical protein K-LCC10_0198 [Kaumoebavirus]
MTNQWTPVTMVLEILPFVRESDPPVVSWTLLGEPELQEGLITELILILIRNGQIPDFLDNKNIWKYLLRFWGNYRKMYNEDKYHAIWDRTIKKMAKMVDAKHLETFVVDARKTRWGRDDPFRHFQYVVRYMNVEGESWEEGINRKELEMLLPHNGRVKLE